MDATELCARVVEHAGTIMRQLTPGDFQRPTPDTEWDAKTLANHMLYELSWIPDMLAGKTIEAVGDAYNGDLIGEDPATRWNRAASRALEAVKTCDMDATAHLSYANVPNHDYLRQASGDLFIHSWDLAAALGLDRTLDPEIAQIIYAAVKPRIAGMQASGLFHAPLEVSDDADIQTKLLALFGRDAGWQPEPA